MLEKYKWPLATMLVFSTTNPILGPENEIDKTPGHQLVL
jgi:hypothetical protein